MNIHKTNLNIKTTAAVIRRLFSDVEHITVNGVRFIKNSFTNMITSFTYVRITDEQLIVRAIVVLNDSTIHGHKTAARHTS